MKYFLVLMLIIFSHSVMSSELGKITLSDCEKTDGWSGGAQLVPDAYSGEFAVAANLAAGKMSGLNFNHGNTGVDLSTVHSLAFRWKVEGGGLRSLMIKIRNYPLVDGMEAVYPIWDENMGNQPKGWQRGLIILSKPRYDNWGGKPDREAKYIVFRTSTHADSKAKLFVDDVAVLPPIFEWDIESPILESGQLALSTRNMTPKTLSVNFGSRDQLLKQITIAPEEKINFSLAMDFIKSEFSQIKPFQSVPIRIWAEAADLEETRMDRTINVIKSGDLPQHPRLLFSSDGVEKLKGRIDKYDWAKARWKGVREYADRLLDEPVKLPPRGGNWWHWYSCPEHGASLRTGKQIGEWQWEHICPVDNAVLQSDPSRPDRDYDGCVISRPHSELARSVLYLGMAYQITGDDKYVEKCREILLAYANRYLSYPLHTTRGEARIGGGRVGPQTLDEAVWLIPICQGADLIWNKLSEEDKDTIAQKMLVPAAREVILPHEMGVHNIQCWKNGAVGLVGFLLGDDELISEAIHHPNRGYWTQIRKGTLSDGIWWEGAWGYHFYTLSSLWGLTEAAYNCGIDLYCDELKSLFDGPIRFAMPDLRLPAFNDSGEVALKGRASIYELAFARYGEPKHAYLISTGNRQNDFALQFGVGDLGSGTSLQWESTNYPNSGYAILAAGEGEKATWLCMKYGPHGGGHGHPDKLNFVLYADGDIVAPDPGTARYGVPIQGGWYKTTLAHNTLVVGEASQKSAEGKCLAFGSKDGIDYAVAKAGDIYDGVDFIRTVALVDDKVILFIDQISCENESLLDIAYHMRGTWGALPDGAEWTPPDVRGYVYLRDATVRDVGDGITLFVNPEKGQQRSLSLAGNEKTQVITATGLERHAEDRVPMTLFRRKAKETAFVWCVGLDGAKTQPEVLPVYDSNDKPLSAATAVSIKIETADGKKRVITINTEKQGEEIFNFKPY